MAKIADQGPARPDHRRSLISQASLEYDPVTETEQALEQEQKASAYRMRLFDQLPRDQRDYANTHGYPPGQTFGFWRLPSWWWRQHGRKP